MVITDQSMVTNITGVALPNGDVLGPVSENYEIKTKCSAQRDNDPKPNPGTRIPTISDFCHVERYASPARTEISLTISVSRYQSETFRDSSAPLGNDKHLQARTSHCSRSPSAFARLRRDKRSSAEQGRGRRRAPALRLSHLTLMLVVNTNFAQSQDRHLPGQPVEIFGELHM